MIAGQNSVPNFFATGLHMKQVISNEFKDKSFIERNLSIKQVETSSYACFNININQKKKFACEFNPIFPSK